MFVVLCAIFQHAQTVHVRYIFLVSVVPALVVAFVCPILETYSLPTLETVVSPTLATFSTLAAAIVVESVELLGCREAKPVFWLNGTRVHLKHGSIFLVDRCSCR